MRMRSGFSALVLTAAMSFAACDESPTGPSSGAVAVVEVGSEVFRVWLRTPDQIEAARAALAGGPASIPNGRIVSGTEVNTGWSWHLEDVTFAAVTIELCDGRPSAVEREGTAFGGGRFCPWSARVVSVNEL